MSDLNRKLGSVEQDNLITSLDPAPIVGVWKIRKETGRKEHTNAALSLQSIPPTMLALFSKRAKRLPLSAFFAMT